MAEFFIDSTLSTLDEHAPVVFRRKRTRRPCPWITSELIAKVQERNRLHRLLMRDKANAVVRKLWRVMNTVTGRVTPSRTPEAPLSDLSTLFGDVVRDEKRPKSLDLPAGPIPENGFPGFANVSVQDVEACLKSVDPTKSTGSDAVPGLILHRCSRVLAPLLATIINTSLASGQVPLSFKLSHISPLFKSGDPALAKNYRIWKPIISFQTVSSPTVNATPPKML